MSRVFFDLSCVLMLGAAVTFFAGLYTAFTWLFVAACAMWMLGFAEED